MKNDEQPPESNEKQLKTVVKKPEATEKAEHGGRGGLDPSRYGDWEIAGKCVDF